MRCTMEAGHLGHQNTYMLCTVRTRGIEIHVVLVRVVRGKLVIVKNVREFEKCPTHKTEETPHKLIKLKIKNLNYNNQH